MAERRTVADEPVATPPAFDAHLHLTQYWADRPTTFYRPDLDYTVHGLLRELRENGVVGGLTLSVETTPTVSDSLREGRSLFRSSGGRLLPVSTVDPTRGLEEVRAAVVEWEGTSELAAVKLYPGYLPFYPHDRRLEPVYEFAAQRRLPVMFHQGDTLQPGGRVKFARPLEVDEVAVAYREVPFVLCHLGNPWIEEAAHLVAKNRNVYADTSGLVWSPRHPYYDRMVARATRRLRNAIVGAGSAERFLYGSDWPLESIELAVGMVRGLDLPPEDVAKILAGNAVALFGLSPSFLGRLPEPDGRRAVGA